MSIYCSRNTGQFYILDTKRYQLLHLILEHEGGNVPGPLMSTSASSRNEAEETGNYHSPFALAAATARSGSDHETTASSSYSSGMVQGSGGEASTALLVTSSMIHASSQMMLPDSEQAPINLELPVLNTAVSLSAMSPFTFLSTQCAESLSPLQGAAAVSEILSAATSIGSQGALLPTPIGPSIPRSTVLAATAVSSRSSDSAPERADLRPDEMNVIFNSDGPQTAGQRSSPSRSQGLASYHLQAAVMKALHGDAPHGPQGRTAAATLQTGPMMPALGKDQKASDEPTSPFAALQGRISDRMVYDDNKEGKRHLQVRLSLDPLGSPNASLIFPAARYSTSLESVRNDDPASQQNGRLSLTSVARDSAAALLQRLQISAQQHPKVRALVVSGGRFVNGPGNEITYQDGDVRLVALPEGGSFAELVTVLAKAERVSLFDTPNNRAPASPFSSRKLGTIAGQQPGPTGGITTAADGLPTGQPSESQPTSKLRFSFGSQQEEKMNAAHRSALAIAASLGVGLAGSTDGGLLVGSLFGGGPRFCVLRYHLPSDPSVFVDVVDDDDVRLMFEEYAEYRAIAGPMARKLKLCVEWNPPGGFGALTRSFDASEEFLGTAYSGLLGSASSLEETNGLISSDPVGSTPRASDLSGRGPFHSAHRSAAEAQLAILRSDQLEIVSPEEVSITELLGTGTFGDMYKASWRECDVAVKCLNPMAVGLQYGSRLAWVRFVDEANSSLGALRHPNLVEVYGVVLPGGKLETDSVGGEEDTGHSSMSVVRPLSDEKWTPRGERHTSWDFSAPRDTQRTRSGEVFGGYGAASTMQRVPGPLVATPALIMEYVSGRSLQRAIARRDDVVAGALARVMFALDVVRAMVYLHDKGIIHFDLKSSNILLARRNHRVMAKVAAYGLTNRKVREYIYFMH